MPATGHVQIDGYGVLPDMLDAKSGLKGLQTAVGHPLSLGIQSCYMSRRGKLAML